LLESATTTIFLDADATTFSRSSAPPPPLIRRSLKIDLIGAVDGDVDFRMFVERGQRNADCPRQVSQSARKLGCR
jgi:hypothetical protein